MRRLVLVVGEGADLPRALFQLGLPALRVGPEQVVAWAQQHPGPVLLCDPAGCSALRLRRVTNLLPLVQLGTDEGPARLRVEPDAVLEEDDAGQLRGALEQALAAHAERLAGGALADLRLSLPSDVEQLEAMTGLVEPWFASCGLTAYQVSQLSLAVREIGANSIEWGHHNDRGRPVGVHCRLDSDKVTVLVRDSGPGFDRDNLPHAARPGDPTAHLPVRAQRNLREGGFGILMASGLVDQLCFSRTGNEALLVKHLPSQPPAQALGP
jgi:anti-sigma regulatory factor (Ser/Thr protein kinase)